MPFGRTLKAAHLDEMVRVAFAGEHNAQLFQTDGAARVHIAFGKEVREPPPLALLLQRAHLLRRTRTSRRLLLLGAPPAAQRPYAYGLQKELSFRYR